MDLSTFQQFSPLHFLCLGICLAVSIAVGVAGTYLREHPVYRTRLQHFIVGGCLLSWLASTVFGFLPDYFRWDFSLPLQFCNFGNILGAWAVGRPNRLAQSLVYFWTLGLCLWAFLTPALSVGPASLWFWIFWTYHLFIPVSLAWVLCVDRYRPTWKDLRQSILVTLAYMLFLAMLDVLTGWNYGYVGPEHPGYTTPIDLLGSYPLRLLWMALIGTAVFVLLFLPWLFVKPRTVSDP